MGVDKDATLTTGECDQLERNLLSVLQEVPKVSSGTFRYASLI